MSRKFFAAVVAAVALAVSAHAQNTNSSTTAAPRTQPTPRRNPTPAASTTPAAGDDQTAPAAEEQPRTRSRRTAAAASSAGAASPAAQAVRNVFDTLVRNIERADADAVMALYWNSPQLTIFNNNGTVTRGWEQVRSNRASSYPEAKNVRVETRDVRVQMLGAGGAVVTTLWRQSQEFRGAPESSAGRLTVVFRLINNGWKIVHTHSSPEAPDPSRLAPSEQTAPPPAAAATPRPPRL